MGGGHWYHSLHVSKLAVRTSTREKLEVLLEGGNLLSDSHISGDFTEIVSCCVARSLSPLLFIGALRVMLLSQSDLSPWRPRTWLRGRGGGL